MVEGLRLAKEEDAASILRIYEPIVRHTAISFEDTPPSLDEMADRIRTTIAVTPWLVYESASGFLGYAYAGRFRGRAAYQWSVEVTVYVSASHQGKGVGRRLYAALLDCLRAQGFRTALAAIALPNPASVALHERLGFEPVGVFPKVGFKLGKWHDVAWWRRALAAYGGAPEPPRPVSEMLRSAAWESALRGPSSEA